MIGSGTTASANPEKVAGLTRSVNVRVVSKLLEQLGFPPDSRESPRFPDITYDDGEKRARPDIAIRSDKTDPPTSRAAA